MVDAEWVDVVDAAGEAGRRLRALGFDQAPVRSAGHLAGFARTDELLGGGASKVQQAGLHPLEAAHLVSANASVLQVMDAFASGLPLVFVVDGREVTGFVTPSDLNKHPARAHFYLLFADLEMALALQVRDMYPDQSRALRFLHPREQRKIEHRFERDRQHDVDVDLVAGMDIAHMLAIASRDRRLSRRFGFASAGDWDRWAHSVISARNAVMHPVLVFLGPTRSVTDLVDLERSVRRAVASTVNARAAGRKVAPTANHAAAPGAGSDDGRGGRELTRMDRELVRRFDHEMENIYYNARDAVGYRATRFRQMVRRRGGVDAAHRLLASGTTSPGFRALAQGGRKDLTVEALVLRPEFRELFSERELVTARNRLDHPEEA